MTNSFLADRLRISAIGLLLLLSLSLSVGASTESKVRPFGLFAEAMMFSDLESNKLDMPTDERAAQPPAVPQIAVTKSANAGPFSTNITNTCDGRPVTIKYRVTNSGTTFLTGVNVDDSDTDLGHIAGPFDLSPGQTLEFTRTRTITGVVSGTVTASGTSGSDTVTSTASLTVTGVVCGVTVTRVANYPNVCGPALVTYTITLTNNSSNFVWEGVLVDTLFGNIDPATFPNPNHVRLLPNESKTYNFSPVLVSSTVTETATATGDTGHDIVPANHAASTTVTLRNCSVTVTKMPSVAQVCNGASVTYDYTVTNNSDFFTWTGGLTDDLLGTIASPLTLGPGASQNFSRTATINGSVTNIATASGSFNDPALTEAGGGASATVTGSTCRITIRKLTNPIGDPAQFSFGGRLAGTISDGGSISADLLAPGQYQSSESVPSGWMLSSITCDDNNSSGSATPVTGGGTGTATFNVELGESVSCTFTNLKFGTAKVTKTVSNVAPSGSQAFTFQLKRGADLDHVGYTIESKTANAANSGLVEFTTKLAPTSVYQFCEANVLPGWTTSLAFLPGAFVPNDNDPAADNGVVCVNFSVNPGEQKAFTVNNTPPLNGPARTIGYWKNWSSCTGGGQAPVLDYVLSTFGAAPATVPVPLPNPPPGIGNGIYMGDLQVNTCRRATYILDKSTITGVKKASDPAYNMAAQLLAAKLNVQGGANPRCVLPYAAEAIQLLETINFDGSTVPSASSAQSSRMNALATYLDRYNNNVANLCDTTP